MWTHPVSGPLGAARRTSGVRREPHGDPGAGAAGVGEPDCQPLLARESKLPRALPRASASSDSWSPFCERGAGAPLSHFPPGHVGSEQVRCHYFCSFRATPSEKKRGDGLERRPPVGIARKRETSPDAADSSPLPYPEQPLSHFPPGLAGSEQVRCHCFCSFRGYAIREKARGRLGAPTSGRHRAEARNQHRWRDCSPLPYREHPLLHFPPGLADSEQVRCHCFCSFGATPSKKKRGDGLERRPPVGIARKRETSADGATAHRSPTGSPPFTLSPRSHRQRTSSLPLFLLVSGLRHQRKSAETAWSADLRSAQRPARRGTAYRQPA